MNTNRKPLSYYLGLRYTFNVIAEEEGGYVIIFPDLPGCMTQVESLDEVAYMAEDVRQGWIETEYERGADIPEPTYAYA
jgi:antitoxin HicB